MIARCCLMLLLFGLASISLQAQPPVPALPQAPVNTDWNPPNGGKTWRVRKTADLQPALDSAKPGDAIILDAGATYEGNFTLPVKDNPSHSWIYIESSALESLPATGKRVNPLADVDNMPKIVTPNTVSAITIPPGAGNYRLVGLEVTTASNKGCDPAKVPPTNCFTYSLVNAASVPGEPIVDSITIDRCYIHGSPTQDVRQGVVANASNIAVVDSYISDIHQGTADSQAVLAYYTPGPIKLLNNFLSATTENVMFGGAGGKNNPWIPSDIEIRGNYLFKPLSWAVPGITLPPHNQWVVKNNLEFKNARRVLVDGNVLENNWLSGQVGFSVLFTVRSSQSGDIAVVQDITFTNNVLKNVAGAFNTLTHDDQCGGTSYPFCTNPGETTRLLIADNLVTFRDPALPGGFRNTGLMVSPDIKDLVFQHNTLVPATAAGCWNAIYFPVPKRFGWPPSQSLTRNVWILDNVLCRGPSGDNGGQGAKGLAYYMGDPAPLGPRFVGNLVYLPEGSNLQEFPPRNLSTRSIVKYDSKPEARLSVSTPSFNKTSDGKQAGVDLDKLEMVVTQATPQASPDVKPEPKQP